jgi:Multicopper oxidase
MINPPRRDVVTLPASNPGDPVGGYIVIAFPLDNPGIWVTPLQVRIVPTDNRSFIVILRGMLLRDWECNSWNDMMILQETSVLHLSGKICVKLGHNLKLQRQYRGMIQGFRCHFNGLYGL